MKLSFSLPSEILCIISVFGACSHAVSHSGSLRSYKQTQKKVHLVLIVAFQWKKGQYYQINCRDFQSSDTICKTNQY